MSASEWPTSYESFHTWPEEGGSLSFLALALSIFQQLSASFLQNYIFESALNILNLDLDERWVVQVLKSKDNSAVFISEYSAIVLMRSTTTECGNVCCNK
jgi:hypothetical protein